jgi:precorrin-6Y C5,15-methyltransferase (decarboxylating)
LSAWLNIVGVGERGVRQLPDNTRLILRYAETVLGPPRFLNDLEPLIHAANRDAQSSPDQVALRGLEAVARALLSDEDDEAGPTTNLVDGRTLIEWEPPLEQMIAQVMKYRNTPTAILATGDPMWYGIGATLARQLRPEEFAIHPFPSAFQLAAAHLHWPLQSVATISLHGRPVENLHSHILPGNRILALATDRTTIDQVTEILANRGYGKSRVHTLENMGAAYERITAGNADSFDSRNVEDFYTIAIDCVADTEAPLFSTAPGLPDDAFQSYGQITKREVRAATIARLAPYPGALLWDVGAGAGSIAIEWMRAVREAKAIAFERDGLRVQMLTLNASTLGAPGLEVVSGDAPESFADKPVPDAIFIGGEVGNERLFDACWSKLRPGGRIVANAVTIEGEQALIARQEKHGGELTRMEIAVLDRIGSQRVFRPRLALVQWAAQKPALDLSIIL